MKELQEKEYEAELLNKEILSTNEKISQEQDDTHIIFLRDYLANLTYKLNCNNAEIYLLRQKQKSR
jgi:hypothetical protein